MIDMQDFLYSVNITLPIILVVLLGYLLRKKGLIDGAFVNIGNMLCFKVAFPLLLFQDLASVDLTKEFHLPFLLYCGAVTTVSFAIVWLLARKCIQDKREIGAFVQGSFRGSAALMGIALIQSIYGSAAAAPFMIIGAVPLYNIYSVIVLTVEGNRKDVSMKKRMGEVVLQVLKNPLIIGILLGMLASLLKLDFPAGIEGTIDSLASLATPLALLVLGAGFEGKKAVAKLPLTLWASSIKLVFQGLIFFPLAVFLGFSPPQLVAIAIMLVSPSTPSSYIMAKSMGQDGVLAGSIVLVTSVLSAFTLTMWIFVMRMLGIIV